jgi:hypothetical protein
MPNPYLEGHNSRRKQQHHEPYTTKNKQINNLKKTEK